MLLDPSRPNVILELGTNVGSTTIILGQAILDSGHDTRLHTVELDPDIHAEAKRRFELAGVAAVIEPHRGNSLDVVAQLVDHIGPIDVAFLDGNHFHDHVVKEFELIADHIRDDGAVIFDNTGLISEDDEDPRVNGALRTIIDRFGGMLSNLPFCSWYTPGIAIWQRQAFNDMTPPDEGSFVRETQTRNRRELAATHGLSPRPGLRSLEQTGPTSVPHAMMLEERDRVYHPRWR